VFPSKLLSPDGRPACAWTARDFGPSGVIGDPLGATREQGEEILETLSDSWVQAITDPLGNVSTNIYNDLRQQVGNIDPLA
jgi:creatinine amidohydrolase/Fe(II)-dependent formamide hydrolase-like protein